MPFHPSIDRKAIREDVDWVWAHTVPAQLSNLAGTYQDIKSGDYGSARARSAAGIQIGLENLAIGSALGGVGTAFSVRQFGKWFVRPIPTLPFQTQIFGLRLLNEYRTGSLEWQDVPRFAAPWLALTAWDRYTSPRAKSSPIARRGNAVGLGGGTKKKQSGRPKRYLLGTKRVWKKGHNPCDKGYSPRKTKGKWYCVLKPKRYLLGSKRVWKKGHNPCDKGYYPRRIKGKWYCVLK